MHQAFQIVPRGLYKAEKPVRDPAFLRFVRMLCCIVCGSYRWVEAAHFGAHGYGQKASDTDTLPLCRWCHRTGPNSYHKLGARRFIKFHALNVQAHQQQIKAAYFEKLKGRVA